MVQRTRKQDGLTHIYNWILLIVMKRSWLIYANNVIQGVGVRGQAPKDQFNQWNSGPLSYAHLSSGDIYILHCTLLLHLLSVHNGLNWAWWGAEEYGEGANGKRRPRCRQ